MHPCRRRNTDLGPACDRFPHLETPRLILRQIQLADAGALFSTFSDEMVMEFYGALPHRTVQESRELVRRQHEWYARRQGTMREALGLLLAFAFEALRLHRVEAVVDEANERSKDLLRALGFTHEGTLRQRFYFRDRFWDEHYFGLLADEWRRRLPPPDA